MSRWSWRSSEGRTQAQQAEHQRREAARNRDRDAAAKRQAEQNKAKGRSIPQRGDRGRGR